MQHKTKTARDEADRHARRLHDLQHQHERLLQLYYRDGVSIEVMQQEQARITREQLEVDRWQQLARLQIDDVMQALDEALLLIDTNRVFYDELPEHERRLLNLALFDDFLIEEASDELVIEPHRDETYVILRQFADEVLGARLAPRHVARPAAAPKRDNPGPLSLGRGSGDAMRTLNHPLIA